METTGSRATDGASGSKENIEHRSCEGERNKTHKRDASGCVADDLQRLPRVV
jgi:hypothetical protein